jgi:hypothetical protein
MSLERVSLLFVRIRTELSRIWLHEISSHRLVDICLHPHRSLAHLVHLTHWELVRGSSHASHRWETSHHVHLLRVLVGFDKV